MTRPTAARRSVASAFGLAVAAVLLAGCQSAQTVSEGRPTDGYRTRYPIVLAEGQETLDIPVGFGTAGLSQSARENVRTFAADAADRGTSALVILTPAGSGNTQAAALIAREARAEALRGGLSPKLVDMRRYPVADPAAAAPVRLAYSRIKAVSPPCGEWTGDLLDDDSPEFGCATQANLAAMVANPEDLVTPRAATAIPASRRSTVLEGWTTDGVTSSGEKLTSAATTED